MVSFLPWSKASNKAALNANVNINLSINPTKKQFEFNKDIEEKIKDTIELIKDGSKKRSSRLLEDVLKDTKDRNKLIRLSDKSSDGWATVMEYLTASQTIAQMKENESC